ncbi:MAG: lytic transglycosylase domain-containing protein [Synergistaceae bacterium]|nr:lytic transglycosylase domain-containing protein [Synergistaceae bacterium]
MRIRTLSCILLVLALLFLSCNERIAWAAPFSSNPEFKFMQRYRTKRDQRNRLKAIETYFSRKNSRVSARNIQHYAKLIDEYSARYDLDPFLVASILVKESTVKEKAVSRGNYGLMQINWKANKPWIVKSLPVRSTKDLLNPENNIRLGATILSANIKKSGGDVDKGLDKYRGRSLASYRNSVLSHYTAIARIFRQLQPASI